MDLVNLDTYEEFVFRVDTKIRDISKWEIVENIAYQKIYRYIKARGYEDVTYHITNHPGVVVFIVPASSIEGETLVKELTEIYPDYEVKMV